MKITALLIASVIFFSSSAMRKDIEVVFTTNSIGGAGHYYTRLQTSSDNAPLSPCGKVITGAYNTGCAVATTVAVSLVNYAALSPLDDLGLNQPLKVAALIGTALGTAFVGLAAWYGGYRAIRPCLTESDYSRDEESVNE